MASSALVVASQRVEAISWLAALVASAVFGFVFFFDTGVEVVVFGASVLVGPIVDRVARRRMNLTGVVPITSVLRLPPGCVFEDRLRTVIRSVRPLVVFIAYDVVGLFFGVIGAAGGGASLGLALVQLYRAAAILRVERQRGWRLFQQVLPEWFDLSPRALYHSDEE